MVGMLYMGMVLCKGYIVRFIMKCRIIGMLVAEAKYVLDAFVGKARYNVFI